MEEKTFSGLTSSLSTRQSTELFLVVVFVLGHFFLINRQETAGSWIDE